MALPTPTALAAVAGYIPSGTRRMIWVTTIANKNAPTSVEITAGSDISNVVSDSAGWSAAADTVTQNNLGTRWPTQIPGMFTPDDSSVTLNMALTGSDAALALFDDGIATGSAPTSGFMVIAYAGLVTGGKLRVFPAQVKAVSTSTAPGDPATATVGFVLTIPPSGFLTVPTA